MNSALKVTDVLEIRLSDPVAAAHWDELVAGSPQPDVYYRAAYVLASAELEQSQPLGLIISSSNRRYLLPMLLRPISSPDGQSWSDASTPYGFGGVICLDLDSGATPSDGADLFQGLRVWSSTRKLVTCVLRSHPMLAQDWLFAQAPGIDFVTVTRRAETVAVPLQLWDETRHCPPEMSKGRCSDLALAHRTLRVTWNVPSDQSDALEQFRIFRVFYENAMRRMGAAEFFHFPWSYYEGLCTLGPDVGIAIAWHGDRAVGGAVFIAGPTYAHYHLSASDETGHKYKASTLLVVEGANWARQRGCRVLHLGGGVHVNDSLMDFKRSFGGEHYQCGSVMLIADRGRYNSMCSFAPTRWPYDQQMASRIAHAGPIEVPRDSVG
jgi:hypothetical protein